MSLTICIWTEACVGMVKGRTLQACGIKRIFTNKHVSGRTYHVLQVLQDACSTWMGKGMEMPWTTCQTALDAELLGTEYIIRDWRVTEE